ncbi:hypothetical protein AVEN_189754-1 [Araneus ventricosus]|uniref:Uncharacterized protein n=1 Tax=Araneus ventricosus TaxID=182803 RepID=A0A4Y2RE21_ARAVE|nr:hypothetical protein AVEN_189754-1 [Araneus ventricosus]
MQDGVTAHTAIRAKTVSPANSPGERVIAHTFPNTCPARSPDLNLRLLWVGFRQDMYQIARQMHGVEAQHRIFLIPIDMLCAAVDMQVVHFQHVVDRQGIHVEHTGCK